MKTLQEALILVPTHWPLVPGVDKWKEGDEYCLTEAVKLAKAGWQKIGDGAVGLELPTKDCETRGGWFIVETVIGIGVRIASDYIARRPTPQSVREAEARWILYNSLTKSIHESGFVPEWMPHGLETLIAVMPENMDGRRVFETQEDVYDFAKLIGGDQAIREMLTEGPGALWRWVEENRK